MRPLGGTMGLLEERRTDVVGLVGEDTARVWRLHLVGVALACEGRRMAVDQILAVRPDPGGHGGTPATPEAWYAACS